jgi:hypothetical protein
MGGHGTGAQCRDFHPAPRVTGHAFGAESILVSVASGMFFLYLIHYLGFSGFGAI